MLELPAADGDVPVGPDAVYGRLPARCSHVAGQSRTGVKGEALELRAGLCHGGPGQLLLGNSTLGPEASHIVP
eukprot:11391143-Alexandrium_andersonii.AAC.1